MLHDAEKYKADDEAQRERVAARNNLESYAYHLKAAVTDESVRDRISDADRKAVLDKCSEVSLVCLFVCL